MKTVLEEVQAAYKEYTDTHGYEPTVLRCSQTVFQTIRHELHSDWNGGDLRFLGAEVVVPDGDGLVGFEFESYE